MAVYLIIQSGNRVQVPTPIKQPFKSNATYTDGIARAAEMAVKKLSLDEQERLRTSGYRVMLYDAVLEVDGKG
jgi:hypothetical protein